MEGNYEFLSRLLEVHKKGRRNPDLLPAADEFAFIGPVCIQLPENADVVARTAASDFADYLFTSMNVPAFVSENPEKAASLLRLILTEDLADTADRRGHRITVDADVTLEAYDSRGLAQGLYYLEDVMNLRRAPFLKKGTERRKNLFRARSAMSGYGIGEYPDEYLSLLAHHGFTAILLWIKGENENHKGFQNFRDLAFRAEKYGFDIYIQSHSHHEMYPEGEEAQKFYDKMYGEIFQKFPFIKGLTIVGEAVGFPSRDPSLPAGKRPGWWPCSDWPLLLSMIRKSVDKHKPGVEINLCSYNWGYTDVTRRQKLIESLPDGVTLKCGWEMFEMYDLDGAREMCCDYSLRVVEPGYYFRTEAEAAARRGCHLETISNTGGKTWDFGAIPFDPAPYRWAERFEYLRDAADRYGLSSLQDSIHFGVYPSFITEIAKWAFAEPRVDLSVKIPEILAMHFGEAELDKVDRAMRLWSEAFANTIPASEDQYGPLRVGPSHPLFAGREPYKGESPPQDKFVMHRLEYGMYCNTYHPAENHGDPWPIRMPKELCAYEKMRKLFLDGIRLLESVEDKNEELLRLIGMGYFMYRTVLTAIHTKNFYVLDQKRMKTEDPAERNEAIDQMIAILKEERSNAEATVPLVEADSVLGFEPSMEYVTDRPRLEWKMRQVDAEIEMLSSLKK